MLCALSPLPFSWLLYELFLFYRKLPTKICFCFFWRYSTLLVSFCVVHIVLVCLLLGDEPLARGPPRPRHNLVFVPLPSRRAYRRHRALCRHRMPLRTDCELLPTASRSCCRQLAWVVGFHPLHQIFARLQELRVHKPVDSFLLL